MKFEFPNLWPEAKEEEMDKQMEQMDALKNDWENNLSKYRHRRDIPSWFGV